MDTMSEIERLLHKAEEKGYREEVINEAREIKTREPHMDISDRYHLAYYKIKKKYKKK